MTSAVIRTWVVNPLRALRKKPHVEGLSTLTGRAFMPKVFIDIWFSDYCRDEVDVIGQWMDDGGRNG